MSHPFEGRTVLVTGANGGLGEQFVHQALQRGGGEVYAAARTTKQWDDPRIASLKLDLTDPDGAALAASAASDVDLLVNNAGIAPAGDSITGPEGPRRHPSAARDGVAARTER